MKKEFREFYNKEIINFKELDDSVLIVLDTNVLLHIFRFSIPSRKKLINSLKKVENNLWIPYHVGLEYNLHKVSQISKMRNLETTLNNEIDREIKKFKSIVFEKIDNLGIKSSDEKEISDGIKKEFDEKLTELITQWKSKELIKEFELIGDVEDESDKIANIFHGKVGSQYTQAQINTVEEEGKLRYANKFPPGYKDESEKGENTRKYGEITYYEKYSDLIIWKQIIDKAKSEEKIDKVIFVTDDEKEDWQYIFKGEKKGPRAELKKELLDNGNADLFLFNTNSFLKQVNDDEIDIVDLELLQSAVVKNKKVRIFKDNLNNNDYNIIDDDFYREPYSYRELDNFDNNDYVTIENMKEPLFRKIRVLKRKLSQLNSDIKTFSNEKMTTSNFLIINNLLNEVLRLKEQIKYCSVTLRDTSYGTTRDELNHMLGTITIIQKDYYNIHDKFNEIVFNN